MNGSRPNIEKKQTREQDYTQEIRKVLEFRQMKKNRMKQNKNP